MAFPNRKARRQRPSGACAGTWTDMELCKERISPGAYCMIPVHRSELDLSEDICESERSFEAFEEIVNDDEFMQGRFAAIRGWNDEWRKEVAR